MFSCVTDFQQQQQKHQQSYKKHTGFIITSIQKLVVFSRVLLLVVFLHDMQLQMSKLRYRLCVREVSDSIQARQSGTDLSAVEDYIVEDTMAAVHAQPAFADPRNHHDNGLHDDDDVTQSPELSSPEGDESLLMPPGKGGMPTDDSGISMDDSAFSMNNSHYTDSSIVSHHDDDMEDDEDDDDCGMNNIHHTSYHHDDEEEEDENKYITENVTKVTMETQHTEIGEPDRETTATTITTTTKVTIDEDGIEEVAEDEIVATFKQSEKPPRRVVTPEEDVNQDDEKVVEDLPDVVVVDKPKEAEEEECIAIEEETIQATVAENKRKTIDLDTSLGSQVEPEPEPEPEPEIERIDFIAGSLVVDDVWTAIDILKTRYRLSNTSAKRYIITSPTTNPNTEEPIAHSSHQNTEAMPWWSKTREPEPVVTEKDELFDMNDNIVTKDKEIKDLLEKVLEEEKKKLAEEEKTKKDTAPSPSRVQPPAPVEEQIVPIETTPESQAPAPTEEEGTDPKKKKGNIFQRMIRALRKRLGHRSRA